MRSFFRAFARARLRIWPLFLLLGLAALFLLAGGPVVSAVKSNLAAREALHSAGDLSMSPGWWLDAFQPLECDTAAAPPSVESASLPVRRLWGIVDLVCGRFPAAEDRLGEVAAALPGDRTAPALLAAARREGGEPVPVQTGVAGWRVTLGKALELYNQGEARSAAEWLYSLRQELEAPADSEYTQLYFWACEIFRSADLMGVSLDACQKLVATDGSNAEAWNQLGASLVQARRYEEALTALDRAISLAPAWTLPRWHRGRALLALGRVDEARAAFQHLLEIEPDNVRARIELGDIALASHDCAALSEHLAALAGQTIGSATLRDRAERLAGRFPVECQ